MTDARQGTCTAQIGITNDQVHWLDSRPQAQHEVKAHRECELETGHPGPHAALGQQGTGVEWWLHWATPEIIETHICPVQSDTIVNAHGEHEPCLLFQGHPGRHSFDLA